MYLGGVESMAEVILSTDDSEMLEKLLDGMPIRIAEMIAAEKRISVSGLNQTELSTYVKERTDELHLEREKIVEALENSKLRTNNIGSLLHDSRYPLLSERRAVVFNFIPVEKLQAIFEKELKTKTENLEKFVEIKAIENIEKQQQAFGQA